MATIQKLGHRPVCVNCGEKYGRKLRGDVKITVHDGFRTELGPWDGVSWFTKYEPFCTLRCALNFARKAAKQTHKYGGMGK